jgi:pyruvate kinase
VELPAHEVPLVQKKTRSENKMARIPVIVATNDGNNDYEFNPTRAEVNDVANP